ncbi:hypothetical protein D3C81_1303720 [compost metagenome]
MRALLVAGADHVHRRIQLQAEIDLAIGFLVQRRLLNQVAAPARGPVAFCRRVGVPRVGVAAVHLELFRVGERIVAVEGQAARILGAASD